MNHPSESKVRMGTGSKVLSSKRLLLGAAIGGLIVLIAIIAIVVSLSNGQEGEEGCLKDTDCIDGSICASGGCIVLIKSQHPGLWREDLKAQLDAGVNWRLHPSFGERLPANKTCPVNPGKVDKPDEGRTEVLADVTVYEIQAERLVLYKYKRFKGTIWLGACRFWFPELHSIEARNICASDQVFKVMAGRDKRAGSATWFIDAEMKQTVPVGTTNFAAVSVVQELPALDAKGLRTLEFTIDAVTLGDETRRHIVAVFPLGSEVSAIEGPAPSQQRLLRGHVAYYWEQGKQKGNVSIRYKPLMMPTKALDMTTINP